MESEAARDWRVRWRLLLSELIGTALLVLGGLSIVIFMFGEGSPVARIMPNELLRVALSGLLFGTVGSAIALSWVGRESGAHINPAVTMGFWMMHKLDLRAAAGYIVAQSFARRIEVARLYYFENDRRRLFHRMAGARE